MDCDMFQHAFKPIWNGEFDIGFGDKFVQPCAFQEIHFVSEDLKIFGFDIGGDIDTRGAFAHFSFDEFLSLLAGHRDAVVAIDDKIHLTDLVENNRGQVDIFIKGLVYTLPTVGELIFFREKSAVKFVIAVQAPSDLIHSNGFNTSIDRAANSQFLFDLIVRKQGGGAAAGEYGQDLIEKSFSTRSAKI